MRPDDIVAKTMETVMGELEADENGLSQEEVFIRTQKYGKNTFDIRKGKSIARLFLEEMFALFPVLLMASALLAFFANSMAAGEGYDLIGIALSGVVLFNIVVSVYQKQKIEKIMDSFMSYIPEYVKVLREGGEALCNAKELVPGDIILLVEGDKVPADCIIVSSNQVMTDESTLTGESGSISKTDWDNALDHRGALYSGTMVVAGNCRALVFETGKRTRMGSISELTQAVSHDLTPMQRQIESFVKVITGLALGIGFSFFLIGFAIGNTFWTNLVFAIGIIVANVPEGLLPTVTLAMTQASQKMAGRNAVVKNILSVETLGSTTVICTDKTGTLTQNRMSVSRAYCSLEEYYENAAGFSGVTEGSAQGHLLRIMSICNEADYVSKGMKREYVGDPTEIALREYVDRVGSSEALRRSFKQVYEKAFSSKDKYMLTAVEGEDVKGVYTAVKGAPEVVLPMCSSIIEGDRTVKLTPKRRKTVESKLADYDGRGLRVLAFAYCQGERAQKRPRNLVFVGLVGLLDPPRPEVYAAVKSCKMAGIRIIVVSGDNPQTVLTIARETGIAENPTVITGKQLNDLSEGELAGILGKNEVIFARTAPEQKLRIVNALKLLEEVVAVTGDGVNDAPALKRADIGVSMGKSGTDVAKEASDIILLDDNFATIVAAVEEGRTVYDNIKRFITYVLTSNIPEIVPFIAYVALRIPLPITVIQILCIDLFTDIVPAIGLGNEPSEKDIMVRPPRKKEEKLVSFKTFVRSYGVIGPTEALLSFVVFFAILFAGGWEYGAPLGQYDGLYMAATIGFLSCIIFSQIGNVMACRTNRQSALTKILVFNPWIAAGVLIEIGFVAFVTSVPEVYRFFSSGPLPWWAWAMMVPAPFIVFGVEELRKYLVRRGFGALAV